MTHDLSGRILSHKFALKRQLGAGGMATVYEAINTQLDKRVAVKVLKAEYVAQETQLIRFKREARNAAQMNHPHIVQITDFDIDGGLPYIVMEHLDGCTLSDLQRALAGPVPWRRVVEMCAQLCSALQYAHDRGLLHRDIKPANVFLLETPGAMGDHVKLLDFGIAKLQDPDESSREPLTSPSQVPGTMEYMAPEQAQGAPCDPRTDLYSLGIMMYRLLTGQLPFHGSSATETLAQHVYRPPTPPSVLVPDIDIPPALEAIVLKAMAKRPDHRWDSAAALSHALRELLGDTEASTQVHELRRASPLKPTPEPSTTSWTIHDLEWRDGMLRRRRVAATLSGASLALCAFMLLSLFPLPGVATLAGDPQPPVEAPAVRLPRPPPPAPLGPKLSPPPPTPPRIVATPDVATPDVAIVVPPTGTSVITPAKPTVAQQPPRPRPSARSKIQTFLKNHRKAFSRCSGKLPFGESIVLHVDLSLEPSTGRLLSANLEESQRTKGYAICALAALHTLNYPSVTGDGRLERVPLELKL